ASCSGHRGRRRRDLAGSDCDHPPRHALRLPPCHRCRHALRSDGRADGVPRRAPLQPTLTAGAKKAHIHAGRCLAIVELLAEGAAEMPLGEIADRLALPKSGAHRLLATLVDLGWAEQDPATGFYSLTMRLAVLGQRFYAASGIPDICQPLLD